jgi:hypothetical protein
LVKFQALIEKFADAGSNTGWTYIVIPLDAAEHINPRNRKAFRVKGRLDDFPIKSKGIMPMGEGNYMMALNQEMRKGINKSVGSKIEVEIEIDTDPIPFDEELLMCLEDAPEARDFFNTLTKGHQKYFSDWIASAKTIDTKSKRIAMSINALTLHWDFGMMIRSNKKKKQEDF